MNVRQYEYILAVAKLKNFGLAAEKCFITQSTLSTMIGKFEDEIGIKIFDRKTKPITITQEGEIIIQQLKVLDKEIETLKETIQSIKGELVGEIKIGVIPTVAPYLLPEFLNDFAKKYPKIKFSVSEMTTDTIVTLLEKREIDIGILAIPLENKRLVEIPLYNEPFVLYNCSNEQNKEYTSLETIDYSKFWLLAEGHCLHNQVTNICDLESSKKNDEVNFNFRAGSIESLVRFVKMNNGLTLLPYLACLDFFPKEYQKVTHFKPPVPVRTIGLVVHNHFVKKQLLDLLKKDIQDKVLPLLKPSEEEYVVSPIG